MPYNSLLKIAGSRLSKRLPLLFSCILCSDRFTVEDVAKKVYYPQTGVCHACYIKAQTTNAKIWCFGKIQKHNSPGYSGENVGCRLLCPDKEVCKMFIAKLTKEKS